MLYIEELTGSSIRNLKNFSIETSPDLNVFFGPNASGKTSILEGIYLLSRLKSFRSNKIVDVITWGDEKLQVFAKGKIKNKSFSVGVEKGKGLTNIKFNGQSIKTASEQVKKLPIYALTPDHHMLFAGSPKDRRRWLDWSLFHVEQDYLSVWKKYHKGVRQRNKLIKRGQTHNVSEIRGWEQQIVQEAQKIDAMRNKYLKGLSRTLNKKFLPIVLPEHANIKYFNDSYAKEGLANSLEKNRKKDAERGYTSYGPHRTDIIFTYQDVRIEKNLSRGQTKLFATALISAQLEAITEGGNNPIMLVDDLYAELDRAASKKMLKLLLKNKAQTFVSSITPPKWGGEKKGIAMFHVEHGNIEKMLK